MSVLKEYKKVGIAGLGGIGSWLTYLLFEFGFKRKQFDFNGVEFDVYDAAAVSTSNLIHQNYNDKDIAKLKAISIADRFVMNAKTKQMSEKHFKRYDLVISCVDAMPFRKSLYEYSWANNTEFIDGRCNSRLGFVTTNEIPKEELLKFISDSQDAGSCLLQYEKDNNICHTTHIVVASMILQMFLNKVRGVGNPNYKIITL